MGLVARVFEAAGLPTVCLTVCAPVTRSVGAPRVVATDAPFGLPFGAPGQATRQRDVLRDALGALETMTTPGELVELPYPWEGAERYEAPEPPPIVSLLKRRPWLYKRLLSGDIPRLE